MAIEKVKAYFKNYGMEDRVMEKDSSSATVEEAADVLGCEPGRIAKTLSFHLDEKVILIVTAGDKKIDNKKYRTEFGSKAHMLKFEEVELLVGHAVGGDVSVVHAAHGGDVAAKSVLSGEAAVFLFL